MNLFRENPEATLAALVASSRKQDSKHYPLINLHEPAKSLLLLKPTAKVPPKKADGTFEKPSSIDTVSHIGGLKMHVDDHSYKMFISWLEDYAAVVDGRYKTVEDLPNDNWIPTQRILRVKGVPKDWAPGTVVQLFVHAKKDNPQEDDGGVWANQPIAFTQSIVTPRGMVNGALMLTQSNLEPSNDEAEDVFPLQPGAYLIKAFVDSEKKIAESPTMLLGQSDYAGQATIDAKWEIGFPKAETFSGESFKR
jgi:hypothetical protein